MKQTLFCSHLLAMACSIASLAINAQPDSIHSSFDIKGSNPIAHCGLTVQYPDSFD